MSNKNRDESKFRRVGLYDAENLRVEHFNKDTEETIFYSILEPFKNPYLNGKEVDIDISIKVKGEKGIITNDGEILD